MDWTRTYVLYNRSIYTHVVYLVYMMHKSYQIDKANVIYKNNKTIVAVI